MKKFLSLVCATIIGISNLAYAYPFDFTLDNLSYNILSETDRTCEVAWSNIYEGDVCIPSKVKFNDVEYTVISIGERAFDGSGGGKDITSITFPETLTTIGEQSFAYCKDLTSLTFPKSLVSIGDGAFFYSNHITSITFPESCSLKTIGWSAFERCYALESLILPNSLETIETYAFRDCKSLSSVIFPESLIKIESKAFMGCLNIEQIENQNKTPQNIEYNTFETETYSNATLKVPNGYVAVYRSHDVWKNFAHIEGGAITGIDEVVQDEGIVKVFTLAGVEVYSGMWNERPELPSGIYVVRVNGNAFKVAL